MMQHRQVVVALAALVLSTMPGVMVAAAPRVEPAIISSGGTSTGTGTVVTLGQPLVGIVGASDVVLSVGFVPSLGLRTGAPPCPYDIDGDNLVAFSDLVIILASWGSDMDDGADVDGSGLVDFGDLLLVLGNWGTVC